jgi:hypothetical protein
MIRAALLTQIGRVPYARNARAYRCGSSLRLLPNRAKLIVAAFFIRGRGDWASR